MQYQFSSDWFSPHTPLWKEKLAIFSGMPDIQGLEIGSFEGRSAIWLLENILTHPTSHLTCVDKFEMDSEFREICEKMKLSIPHDLNIEECFDANILASGASQRITKRRGASNEVLRNLALNSFDFIYIDGSHTTRNVLRDAVLSWDLLKLNGILIFDDYRWNPFEEDVLMGPKKAIDAFMECFDGEYVLMHMDYQVMLRKTHNIRDTVRSLSMRCT